MYEGKQIQIPVGQGGLMSDVAPNLIPENRLISAKNVQLRNGVAEKCFGAYVYIKFFSYNGIDYDHIVDVDDPALGPAKIVGVYDWWPDSATQRLIVVTQNGRVYSYSNPYVFIEVVPSTVEDDTGNTAPTRLSIIGQVTFVECGREFLGTGGTSNPKKLFIFTGGSQIQVLENGTVTRRNIQKPAADWDGSTGHDRYPVSGVSFFNRVFVFGQSNLPHFVYGSSNTVSSTELGHEDFTITTTFNTALFNVYPGEGERVQAAFEFKNKLHVLKYPKGLYQLQQPDIGNPIGWYFAKLNNDIGVASSLGVIALQDDVFAIQDTRMLQSLSATLNLGGIEAANVYRALGIQTLVDENTSSLGIGQQQAIWHEAKRAAYFLYRGASSLLNNFLVKFDYSENTPKAIFLTAFQPNSLGLRKNVTLVNELMYGSSDGLVYLMDQAGRYVGTDASVYTSEFQTPHMDFKDPRNKLYDFVEIEYIPTGNVTLSMDWFIEGRKQGTKSFNLGKANQLDSFILDQSRLQGTSTRKQRLKITGRGRSLSLKFYNSDAHNFRLTGITVSYRDSGEKDKGEAPEDT